MFLIISAQNKPRRKVHLDIPASSTDYSNNSSRESKHSNELPDILHAFLTSESNLFLSLTLQFPPKPQRQNNNTLSIHDL